MLRPTYYQGTIHLFALNRGWKDPKLGRCGAEQKEVYAFRKSNCGHRHFETGSRAIVAKTLSWTLTLICVMA
jgi:hypothetical protein